MSLAYMRSRQTKPKNPNATLPTIAVGDETHISTAEVTSYLLKHAPKPTKSGTSLIAKIHEDKYDPNFALFLAVRVPFD